MEVDKNRIETYRTSYNFIMDYLDRYEVEKKYSRLKKLKHIMND